MYWLKLYWYTWMLEYNIRMFKQTGEFKYDVKHEYYLTKLREIQR